MQVVCFKTGKASNGLEGQGYAALNGLLALGLAYCVVAIPLVGYWNYPNAYPISIRPGDLSAIKSVLRQGADQYTRGPKPDLWPLHFARTVIRILQSVPNAAAKAVLPSKPCHLEPPAWKLDGTGCLRGWLASVPLPHRCQPCLTLLSEAACLQYGQCSCPCMTDQTSPGYIAVHIRCFSAGALQDHICLHLLLASAGKPLGRQPAASVAMAPASKLAHALMAGNWNGLTDDSYNVMPCMYSSL